MLPAPAPGARPLGRTGGPGREGRTPTDGRTLGPQAARREREVFVYFDKRRDGSCPVQCDALARGLGAHDLPTGRGENMSPDSASGHPKSRTLRVTVKLLFSTSISSNPSRSNPRLPGRR
jgi:hypothetical protein